MCSEDFVHALYVMYSREQAFVVCVQQGCALLAPVPSWRQQSFQLLCCCSCWAAPPVCSTLEMYRTRFQVADCFVTTVFQFLAAKTASNVAWQGSMQPPSIDSDRSTSFCLVQSVHQVAAVIAVAAAAPADPFRAAHRIPTQK